MKIKWLLAVLAPVLYWALSLSHPAQAIDVIPDQLAAEAASQGTVRVIVRLDVGFRPEGVLPSAAAIADQRRIINTVQNSILSALAGIPHVVTRRYETVPLLALEVGPIGLNVLEALASQGLVAQVQEDRILRPL